MAEGARATLITAPATPLAAWKQWIAGSMAPGGSLTLDDGAVRALKSGKSLLPSGIVSVSGTFEKGDSLRLLDASGAVVGVGLASYPADEIALIRGRHSDEIETLIGYRGPSVVIHRDDLVLETR
ncbi:Glutamate 5-kinase [compost metagenome]